MKRPPYDPELEGVLKLFPVTPLVSIDMVKEQRVAIGPMASPEATIGKDPDIIHEERTIPGPGGTIALSILRSRNSAGGARPAIYYIHGGGMILGSKLFLIECTFEWIKQLDVVLISVEYRLAPEHPNPAPVEDCYAGLKWVVANAKSLGIDVDKVIVAGHSAGGGLSAGISLLARDRGGPKIFAQCLIYPMLDDRMITASSKQFMNEGTWSGVNNVKAWEWYIPGHLSAKEVSIYAAPSRATDLSGLPPTWIDVGGNEIFRDENAAYASKLAEDGVSVEFHVWPGAFHGFDLVAPTAQLTKSCLNTRMAWFKRILSAPVAPLKIPTVL